MKLQGNIKTQHKAPHNTSGTFHVDPAITHNRNHLTDFNAQRNFYTSIPREKKAFETWANSFTPNTQHVQTLIKAAKLDTQLALNVLCTPKIATHIHTQAMFAIMASHPQLKPYLENAYTQNPDPFHEVGLDKTTMTSYIQYDKKNISQLLAAENREKAHKTLGFQILHSPDPKQYLAHFFENPQILAHMGKLRAKNPKPVIAQLCQLADLDQSFALTLYKTLKTQNISWGTDICHHILMKYKSITQSEIGELEPSKDNTHSSTGHIKLEQYKYLGPLEKIALAAHDPNTPPIVMKELDECASQKLNLFFQLHQRKKVKKILDGYASSTNIICKLAWGIALSQPKAKEFFTTHMDILSKYFPKRMDTDFLSRHLLQSLNLIKFETEDPFNGYNWQIEGHLNQKNPFAQHAFFAISLNHLAQLSTMKGQPQILVTQILESLCQQQSTNTSQYFNTLLFQSPALAYFAFTVQYSESLSEPLRKYVQSSPMVQLFNALNHLRPAHLPGQSLQKQAERYT